jgi:hypothetical protein
MSLQAPRSRGRSVKRHPCQGLQPGHLPPAEAPQFRLQACFTPHRTYDVSKEVFHRPRIMSCRCSRAPWLAQLRSRDDERRAHDDSRMVIIGLSRVLSSNDDNTKRALQQWTDVPKPVYRIAGSSSQPVPSAQYAAHTVGLRDRHHRGAGQTLEYRLDSE